MKALRAQPEFHFIIPFWFHENIFWSSLEPVFDDIPRKLQETPFFRIENASLELTYIVLREPN
jgi:hypothetical protein